MQFIDLKTQYATIEQDVQRRLKAVLDHGQYILGPEVAEMEERLADYVGVKHCVSVSSGSDALLAALMALGVGEEDEVITSPFSFIAPAEMIALLGATPVFVDIDAKSYNLDASLIEAAITPRTRAIMPVSLYGQCADFDVINEIAQRRDLAVIEDAAQSFGATYKGRRSCALSTIGCTSFFPSKPLGCYGDGGACFTDDDNLAAAMREIRVHGQGRRYRHTRAGINGRMDTLQAAIILAKLKVFPAEIEARGAIGRRYSESLAGLDCVPPYFSSGYSSVYAQYTIQLSARDKVAEYLNERGIPTAIHYPMPVSAQPAMQGIARVVGDLSVTFRATERVMSLPMHPYLKEQDTKQIVNALADAIGAIDAQPIL